MPILFQDSFIRSPKTLKNHREMGYMHVLCLFFTQIIYILMLVAETTAYVPAIIVFGDSSVDAGNNNVISTVLKSNFKPYGRDFEGGRPTGRFCNGRIPPDFISEAFGLKPAIPAYLDSQYSISDFATGVCFASAGTGYDNATSNVLNVIPLWKELEYYKDYQNKLRAYVGDEKANEIFSEALYLMSLGTNDFLENYYTFPTRRSQFTVRQYEDFLVGLARDFTTKLYHLGGRKISLTGVPPMGCLPLERTTNIMGQHDCTQEYNKVAVEFNGKLEGLVSELKRELPGLRMLFTNVYDDFYQIIRSPAAYGFQETGMACCATGTFEMSYLCNEYSVACPDANKYVFWDAFHPTERTNQIISQQLIPILLAEFQ
ncbi:GDSL esterase/lipase [Populus alba x Populus x berolinensis]|uniref:GDSL esterase/lipase n=1 Tax=Populus alba x Populus x berolinensis TaxID=444605 RepID=A0AAD6RHZ2_9ROSI|nr:GDSL esterase/lipase [Populus alba x Populus x berolinensis]